MRSALPSRSLSTADATRIGIGAIVGGGIFVLAGTAYAYAGPAAILAFGLNGVLALLTAMSFAEMASAYPESGGAYNFAKRVLSVRAAFAAGWVLWLAYIVAGVLYAMGFAAYGAELLAALINISGLGPAPSWVAGRETQLVLAIAPIIIYTNALIQRPSGGGALATWGKVVALVALLIALGVALPLSPPTQRSSITPFMPGGISGLLSAMGFTFIALQGFDLIAAVAGEVKEPQKAIPKAMIRSLVIALVIYLPLLVLVAIGGTGGQGDIQTLARSHPDTFMATAAGNMLGPAGYWLVTVAAVLATLSALHANILAASRVAFTMGTDRTLPWIFTMTHEGRGTPLMALYLSGLAMATLVFLVPDLATAGAAASLIFLMSFSLAHGTAFLARRRQDTSRLSEIDDEPPPYQTPYFPLVPAVGGLSCMGLVIFQIVFEPRAAVIALIWLGLGVVLYLSIFAERAQALDAAAEATDGSLARLRGRSPLVLVPIVNPQNAKAMAQVASALTPPRVGKVLMLSVLRAGAKKVSAELAQHQQTLGIAMSACLNLGHRPEALITVASNPWFEIERVANARACERLLLGMGDLEDRERLEALEGMMGRVNCELSVLSAPAGWDLTDAHRILVPIGGRGNHDEVRARLVASLLHAGDATVHFLRVVPSGVSDEEMAAARKSLRRLAHEEAYGRCDIEVARGDDVVEITAERAARSDLVILGLQRLARSRRGFSDLGLRIAQHCPVATIMIGGR